MNPLNNQENHSMLHMSTAWEFDPWCCEGLAHKTMCSSLVNYVTSANQNRMPVNVNLAPTTSFN